VLATIKLAPHAKKRVINMATSARSERQQLWDQARVVPRKRGSQKAGAKGDVPQVAMDLYKREHQSMTMAAMMATC